MSNKTEQAEKIKLNIKSLRGNLGWNQSKLASEADISGAALSKIEKDKDRIPTISVLQKLAKALKVDISEITGEHPIQRSESEERNNEFYRKFGIISDLSQADQEMLLGMAERLKAVTKE